MNQLEQLEVYLKHLGRPYVIKDVDPKAFNKVPYTDENGKDNEVEYTKVVTIDSPESVKDYYPKIDLWYIPSLDKFVEHGSATDGETNALQADTAKDILDYIGYVYWEMEDLGDQLDNVSEAANDVQFGKLTDYLDEMGIKYKVSDKNGTIDYVDASNGDKTATYTKEVEVSPGNTVYYIPELEGFIDPSDDASGGNNDLFVMDAWETARLMGSVYFDEDPEDTEKRLNGSKKESKMKNYECSMQKKIESFKKSESSKTDVRSNKKNEGPGAGYTVTIKEMTIAEEPKITYDEAKDVFKVVAPVEYEADAEGYDWSSAYIVNELMGMDEGTFPYNPFKGELELEIPNDESVWNEIDGSAFDDAENPTIDEKLDVLHSAFYKDKKFDDFSENYGGGWSHSKYTDVAQLVATPDWYGDFEIDFATSTDFNGTLTIDEYFLQDIEVAHDYNSNRYELVEAIKKYISDKGLEPSWNEDSIYDYVAPYVTDKVTDEYVKETLQEMIDSGLEFYNQERDPVEIDLT